MTAWRDLRRSLDDLYARRSAAKRPGSAVNLLRRDGVALALLLCALYRWQAG